MSGRRHAAVAVPCNGCTLCCRHEMIILHPEDGDDIGGYETKVVPHPLHGKPVFALQQRPNGECVYLGASGCTIHDRAPVICRKFDCRALARAIRKRDGRAAMLRAAADEPVIARGQRLLRECAL